MPSGSKAGLAALTVAAVVALPPTAATATPTAEPAGASGAVAAAGPERGRDLAAFEEILRRQEAAWAAEDGRAFAATFTEDADVVTFNGDHFAGRAAIAAGMQHAFDHYIPPSRIVRLGEHIRFGGPDLAFIVRTSCIINEGQQECRPGSLSRNTNVLRKRHGVWLQTSFQNTRVQPLPEEPTSNDAAHRSR
jgi:uncharacterized protein (TIGR02246 family)